MNSPFRKAVIVALLSFSIVGLTITLPVYASPLPKSSVIYSIYLSIFSPSHNFAGVTAQLVRLKYLGVTVIWLMPITPVGQPVNGHPAFNSPYCVRDYFGVNSYYGTPQDLRSLIVTAHRLGIRVILDEVLNHTSWDNRLITEHPDFYIHSDGNSSNPNSIVHAFNFNDVAQLNYTNRALRAYMARMLRYWLTQYHVDGFRFDTADDPDGPGRMIPSDFWIQLGVQLRATNPNVLLLGECETPDLALQPFQLDYGWRMYGAIKAVSNGGDASQIQTTWNYQADNFPTGMLHMSIQDDWDNPRDVDTFGGASGALAVATFYLTETGIPMIYNGMEIGNSVGAVNPHEPINWTSGNPEFPNFYHALLGLRHQNMSIESGRMTWVPNSAASKVVTYTRTGGPVEFLVEINLSSDNVTGAITTPIGIGWHMVRLPCEALPGDVSPTDFSLLPKQFLIFRRSESHR